MVPGRFSVFVSAAWRNCGNTPADNCVFLWLDSFKEPVDVSDRW